MKATIPFIEQKFHEFNRQVFKNELPDIKVALSRSKSYMGAITYRKRKWYGMEQCGNFKMLINGRADLPEDALEDIILHEMIHYYLLHNKLTDGSPHGPLFRSWMKYINDEFGHHITVTHRFTDELREQLYDQHPHVRTVAVVRMRNGRFAIKVLPESDKVIKKYYNEIKKSDLVDSIALYHTESAYFNRFPCSSALNIFYVKESEILPHLEGAERIK